MAYNVAWVGMQQDYLLEHLRQRDIDTARMPDFDKVLSSFRKVSYGAVIFSDSISLRGVALPKGVYTGSSAILYLAEQARELGSYRKTPFILAHTGGLLEPKNDYYDAGINHFIDIERMPAAQDTLAQLVMRVLRQGRAR
jgi:hypothetical protein